MTFDKNTATPAKKWPLLFLKPPSRELNISNKVKVKIGRVFEAVCWFKVWSNWRIWADIGNTKDVAVESQKTRPRPKKGKIRKLGLRMGNLVSTNSQIGKKHEPSQ